MSAMSAKCAIVFYFLFLPRPSFFRSLYHSLSNCYPPPIHSSPCTTRPFSLLSPVNFDFIPLWDKTRSFWDIKNPLSHERGSEGSERVSKRVSAVEGASEASNLEQANEWTVRANEQTSKWTSEWLSTYAYILVCSRPRCIRPFFHLFHLPFTSFSFNLVLSFMIHQRSKLVMLMSPRFYFPSFKYSRTFSLITINFYQIILKMIQSIYSLDTFEKVHVLFF